MVALKQNEPRGDSFVGVCGNQDYDHCYVHSKKTDVHEPCKCFS